MSQRYHTSRRRDGTCACRATQVTETLDIAAAAKMRGCSFPKSRAASLVLVPLRHQRNGDQNITQLRLRPLCSAFCQAAIRLHSSLHQSNLRATYDEFKALLALLARLATAHFRTRPWRTLGSELLGLPPSSASPQPNPQPTHGAPYSVLRNLLGSSVRPLW